MCKITAKKSKNIVLKYNKTALKNLVLKIQKIQSANLGENFNVKKLC